MPGYRFQRQVVGSFGTTDPGVIIPMEFLDPGNGFIRIYRWKYSGLFQSNTAPAFGQLFALGLCVVAAFIVPHPPTGSKTFDFIPFGTPVVAGTGQFVEWEKDYGTEGMLFSLNLGSSGFIGLCDSQAPAPPYLLSGYLEIDYGYDMTPQLATRVAPGPL